MGGRNGSVFPGDSCAQMLGSEANPPRQPETTWDFFTGLNEENVGIPKGYHRDIIDISCEIWIDMNC